MENLSEIGKRENCTPHSFFKEKRNKNKKEKLNGKLKNPIKTVKIPKNP